VLFYGIAVLSEMLYDGGHTYLKDPIIDNIDAVAVEAFDDVGENENDPRTILFNKWTSINKPARDAHNKIKEYNDGYKSYTPIFAEYNGNGTIKAAYFEYDDTGIYVFSSFEEDTIKNFRKALDLAKEHGMKNFLLDESYNEGGKAPVMCYMLGIMTNQKSLYYKSAFSGDILESVYKCDYNLDGIFGDSREDAGYDFKYGILCSTNAFSCGSLLPVYAKEAGIPIIGETSGGGTCVVGYFNLPNAYNGQYSSYKTIVYQDGNDVEKGATPDYDITKLAADGSVDYSDFHDFALLDSILDRHYADKSPASDRAVDGKQATVGQTIKVSSVPKTGDKGIGYE